LGATATPRPAKPVARRKTPRVVFPAEIDEDAVLARRTREPDATYARLVEPAAHEGAE
jgi:hypothetical protein